MSIRETISAVDERLAAVDSAGSVANYFRHFMLNVEAVSEGARRWIHDRFPNHPEAAEDIWALGVLATSPLVIGGPAIAGVAQVGRDMVVAAWTGDDPRQ